MEEKLTGVGIEETPLPEELSVDECAGIWGTRMHLRQAMVALGGIVMGVNSVLEASENIRYAVYTMKQGWTTETVAQAHNRIYQTSYSAGDINGFNKLKGNHPIPRPVGSKIYVPVLSNQKAIVRAKPINPPRPEPNRTEAGPSIHYPSHWNSEAIRLINLENNGRAEDDGGLDTFLQRRFHDPNNLIPGSKLSLKPLPQPNNSSDRFVPNRANFARTRPWETYICMKLQPVTADPEQQRTSYGYVGYKHPQRGLVLTHSFLIGQGKRGSETPERAIIAGEDGKEVNFEDDIFGANYWSPHAQKTANLKSLEGLTKRGWQLSYSTFEAIGECASYEAARRLFRIEQSTYNTIKRVYIPKLAIGSPVPKNCQWGYMPQGRVQVHSGVFWHGTAAEWTAGLARSRMCLRSTKKDFALMSLAFGFRPGSGLDIQRVR